ncbi:MAG TPA: hypothetical protein VN108_07645, partial [Marmoricola sp.]|nr:hypothetical protein [Marmoricola sp.]
IYRRDEYKTAGVPVVSVARGVPHTKRLILIYTVLFSATALTLPLFSEVGIVYTCAMALICVTWLAIAIFGLGARDNARWARANFRYSLWVVLAMCVLFVIGPVLP